MSTNLEPSSNDLSVVQQRRQANILLLRLQWLLILLLIAALLWLYISQQRFQNQITERIQGNEQVVSRLNEMDDRLFAISQQSPPMLSKEVNSQAQNQLDLLRIQIQAVDRLLADNNSKAATELLRGLQWQLSQPSNEIAPALTIIIQQSLSKDVERLQAQSSQPSPWQLQNLAIQNIQEFLHNYERLNTQAPVDNKSNQNSSKNSTNNNSTNNNSNNIALTRQQLTIHEVIMTLSLASQASNMRDKELLISYLRQARSQLQALTVDAPKTTTSKTVANSPSTTNNTVTADSQHSLETMDAPQTIAEVIDWLDKLIANAPKATVLLTTQILDKPNL